MGKVAVSVIIPTYNRAKFIVESVESVLSQSTSPAEVIVIDNGSTDDTETQLKPLLKHINYTKIPPSGRPSIPRNFGIRQATGSLIAFQDSDDIWTIDKIKDQLPAMEDPKIILSYGNAEVITGEGNHTGKLVIPADLGKSGWVFNDLIATNFVSTLTVMTRKDALVQTGGFNESPGLVEDWELWLRMSRIGQFKYVDKSLAYYRRHDHTISAAFNDGTNEYALQVYRTIIKQPLLLSEKEMVHRNIAYALYSRAGNLHGISRLANQCQAIYQRILAKLLALIG